MMMILCSHTMRIYIHSILSYNIIYTPMQFTNIHARPSTDFVSRYVNAFNT